MITSYNLTNGSWQLLSNGVVRDTFYLPDTEIREPAGGANLGVLLYEYPGNHKIFLSNQEIVDIGLTDIAGLTAQFNTDKAASLGSGAFPFPMSSPATQNILIGTNAGGSITTGAVKNVLIGSSAGSNGDFDGGSGNVGIGDEALNDISTGDHNVGIGTGAGFSLSTAGNCVFIGQNAGYYVTTGVNNIGIGRRSCGAYNNVGNGNTCVGHHAGEALSATAAQNTCIGHNAGWGDDGNYALNGTGNICLGSDAGAHNTDNNYTIFVGFDAGAYTNGDDNIIIGRNCFQSQGSVSNTLAIHSASGGSGATPLIHGKFDTGILTVNSTFVVAPQTAASAAALTPTEGMIVVVNSTDATFTSTGSWIYEGAAWAKITVV